MWSRSKAIEVKLERRYICFLLPCQESFFPLPGVRRQQMYWKSLATPNVVEVYCKGKNLQNIPIFDKSRYLWDGKHFWWHKHVVLWSKNEHCQTSLVEMKLSFFFSRDAFFDVKLNNRIFLEQEWKALSWNWKTKVRHILCVLKFQSKETKCELLIRKSWSGRDRNLRGWVRRPTKSIPGKMLYKVHQWWNTENTNGNTQTKMTNVVKRYRSIYLGNCIWLTNTISQSFSVWIHQMLQ